MDITSPHQHFGQRLGAPFHGQQPFVQLLPASVRKAFRTTESIKVWLVNLLTDAESSYDDRIKVLEKLLEALGRATRPDSGDKADKRASMASLSSLVSGITVPTFVAAVVCEVLLNPKVRLEIGMWDMAAKHMNGRLADIGVILSSARLKHGGEGTQNGTTDVGE